MKMTESRRGAEPAQMKTNLWHVSFTTALNRGPGCSTTENRECYAVTETTDLKAVESEISEALDNQTSLTKITRATWLGEVLRSPMPPCPVCADVWQRLKGHPDSRLDGENGLAAATMRALEMIELEKDMKHDREISETLQDAEEYYETGTGLPGSSCAQ